MHVVHCTVLYCIDLVHVVHRGPPDHATLLLVTAVPAVPGVVTPLAGPTCLRQLLPHLTV